MELSVPDRIQVMPVGYEIDRVTEAAEEFKPDKVILISHNENDEKADHCLAEITEYLEDHRIEYDLRVCDIFDLYDSLGSIAQAIHEHQNDDVYVNTATGSKITAIAGMIASMVTDSTAYYVKAERYEDVPRHAVSFQELPKYPIDHPEISQIATMEYIRRMEDLVDELPTKGELIQFAQTNSLGYMDRSVDGKGKYRLLDTHIIEPLDNEGYVEMVKDGRKTLIKLSDSGRNAIQAYQYLIPDMESINWDPSQKTVDTSAENS